MKLFWAINDFYVNGGYGYSVHREKMKHALIDAGVEITYDKDDTYDLAVHIIFPSKFFPVPGRKNLLFTQTEATEPFVWSDTVAEADVLVTSSRQSVEVCSRYYAGPVEYCPEGVDPKLFPFHQRKAPAPGEPFRILFVGNDAQGARKGIDLAQGAVDVWLNSGRAPSNIQLYLKTTNWPGPELRYLNASMIGAPLLDPPLFQGYRPDTSPALPGVVIDTRNLPVEELVALYNSAHAFLFPSMGEAWGLTLTDAMATGAPCIFTKWSAMKDYADESVGYPLDDFRMVKTWAMSDEPGRLDVDTFAPEVTDEGIIAELEEAYNDYDEALARGRRASERMHSQYTWGQAAEKFIAICERYACNTRRALVHRRTNAKHGEIVMHTGFLGSQR